MAERIQRRRTAGWRLPEGAVIVDRTSSSWGNPYRVGEHHGVPGDLVYVRDNAHAVELYREWLSRWPEFVEHIRAELAGKDLACWCKSEDPCHGDVLLRVAAGGEP